jgi:hypothetical protein
MVEALVVVATMTPSGSRGSSITSSSNSNSSGGGSSRNSTTAILLLAVLILLIGLHRCTVFWLKSLQATRKFYLQPTTYPNISG